MSYKNTGNKIPVTREELINYMNKQLAAYDSGKLQNPNPYTEQVIYITKDKKMIQIPQDIQREAVALWNPQREMMPIHINMEQSNTGKTDYVTIGILILAGILAIFLFYKAGLIGNINVNPGTRFYLTN